LKSSNCKFFQEKREPPPAAEEKMPPKASGTNKNVENPFVIGYNIGNTL
jgi:hypothetical protein